MREGLRGKRNFGNSFIELLPFFFMLSLILLTFYNLFFSTFNLKKVIKMNRSMSNIDMELRKVKERNEKLDNLIKQMDKNSELYVEKFIREYMQLQKSGEKIILFK